MNANRKRSTGLFRIAALGLLAGACAGAAPAISPQAGVSGQPTKQPDAAEPVQPGLKPGSPAPTFKLPDVLGKESDLAALTREGKIVVVEWFNPECDWVAKYHKDSRLMADTHKKFASKGVAWLAINSSQDALAGDVDRNRKAKVDWGIEYPILRDRDASVAKLYGVTKTPHIFIIGTDGKVAYTGAADDAATAATKGTRNYISEALERLVADETVKTNATIVNGCPVGQAATTPPKPPSNPPK